MRHHADISLRGHLKKYRKYKKILHSFLGDFEFFLKKLSVLRNFDVDRFTALFLEPSRKHTHAIYRKIFGCKNENFHWKKF